LDILRMHRQGRDTFEILEKYYIKFEDLNNEGIQSIQTPSEVSGNKSE
jgi:hypothetical protein